MKVLFYGTHPIYFTYPLRPCFYFVVEKDKKENDLEYEEEGEGNSE